MKYSLTPLVVLFAFQTAVAADRYFPIIANGHSPDVSYRSTITLTNTSDTTLTGSLIAYDDGGMPNTSKMFAVSTDQMLFTLGPGATQILATPGSGSLITGSVTVSEDRNLNKLQVSEVLFALDSSGAEISESGVLPSESGYYFRLPVEISNSCSVGFAIQAAPAPRTYESVDILLALIDQDGQPLYFATRSLPKSGKLSMYVTDLFPDKNLASFVGSLQIVTSQPVAVLSLRLGNASRFTMATIPAEIALQLPVLQNTISETEPNDTIQNANLVSTSANLMGAIGKPNDIDVYKVYLKAGQLIAVDCDADSLDLTPPSQLIAPDLSLLSDQGGIVTQSVTDLFRGELDGGFVWKCTVAGYYYIKIANTTADYGNYVYRLKVYII
jgi:hypothetical protein